MRSLPMLPGRAQIALVRVPDAKTSLPRAGTLPPYRVCYSVEC